MSYQVEIVWPLQLYVCLLCGLDALTNWHIGRQPAALRFTYFGNEQRLLLWVNSLVKGVQCFIIVLIQASRVYSLFCNGNFQYAVYIFNKLKIYWIYSILALFIFCFLSYKTEFSSFLRVEQSFSVWVLGVVCGEPQSVLSSETDSATPKSVVGLIDMYYSIFVNSRATENLVICSWPYWFSGIFHA